MLCYAMLCHTMLCFAIIYYAMLYAMLCNTKEARRRLLLPLLGAVAHVLPPPRLPGLGAAGLLRSAQVRAYDDRARC